MSLSGNALSLGMAICFLLFACTCAPSGKGKETEFENLNIQANLVFFYYNNLSKAVQFYENTLGLKCVLDYGFAKIYRISNTSYVGLVDESKGMHSAFEPKTVTLSFITGQVDTWFEYLTAQGVKIHSPLGNSSRIPIRGFVALDPEGYFLEFETFLTHPQNEQLLTKLEESPTFYPNKGPAAEHPQKPGFQGNIIWLYYTDLAEAQKFYEHYLGLELLVDQGFAKVYSSSPTGFIGLVDEARGLHRFSEEKAVNVSFFTDDIDRWYRYLLDKGLKMRGPLEDAEADRVRAFVTYDAGEYYIEFDQFIDHEDNKELLKILR